MIDFLQDYGIWILFGSLFLLILLGRSWGIGCGMGIHGEHHREDREGRLNKPGDHTDHPSNYWISTELGQWA
jgi:hypothetical protein